MSVQRAAIRAALGRVVVAGVGVLRATDISVDAAVSEITARSGCDPSPWYRDKDTEDLTGSLTFQDQSPDLIAAVTGGTLTAAGSGYALVDKEGIVGATLARVLLGAPLLNADGTVAGTFWYTTATGEVVLSQIAPDGSPADGEFCYDTTDPDALIINVAQNGTTIYGMYAYAAAGGKMVTRAETDQAPLVSLLLPACVVPMTAQGTRAASGIYIPRVRFLGSSVAFAPAGSEFQGQPQNFVIMPDATGKLYDYLFPA